MCLFGMQIILSCYFCWFCFGFFFVFLLCYVFVAKHSFFHSCGEQGLHFTVMHRLLIAVTSLVAKHRL